MIQKINLRVYGLCLRKKKVLALHEHYQGHQLVKFPGGGLELGEGIIDCLKREFSEELNLNLTHWEHFYTQEDFIVSKFRPDEQLLTVYYLVETENHSLEALTDPNIEKTEWLPLESEDNPFPLPVDRIVFDKLKKHFL